MFSDIIKIENLMKSFMKLKRNISETPFYGDFNVDFYEKHLGINLLLLHQKLKNDAYSPNELYIWKIDKEDGDIRTIYKRDIEDCIVEIAILNVLGPFFEPLMDDNSFGNRLSEINNPQNYIYKPYWEEYKKFEESNKNAINSSSYENKVIRSDIKSFFDEITVGILIQFLRDNNVSARVLNLIELFLNISTKDYNIQIIAQGTFLAPFFANIYLIPFDAFLRENDAVLYYSRYVDDILIILEEIEDENTFFSEIQDFFDEELLLNLHIPTRDPNDKEFKKSFIGNLNQEVKERFSNEFKKRIYGETQIVENLAKSGNLDSSLFLQLLLLQTNQKVEGEITKRELIAYTQRFLQFWRKWFIDLSDYIEIERIATKALELNQIRNVNVIRLFFSVMLEANGGTFSIFLKNLLKNPPSEIIRGAFISVLPSFISGEEDFNLNSGVKEILSCYLDDNRIDKYLKFQISQLIILIGDSTLLSKAMDLLLTPFLIHSYQVIDNPSFDRRLKLNQIIEAFSSNDGKLVLNSYKVINKLNLAQNFFNHCSQERIIQKIKTDFDYQSSFIQLLIFCDGLNPLNSAFNIFLNSQDTFTLQLIHKLILNFLNFTNIENLGVTTTKYFDMLKNCSNFFNNWNLSSDLKNKIDLKIGSYVRESGDFTNFPFATSYPNISYRKVSPTIIREIRTGYNSISNLFHEFPSISDLRSSKAFISECFGNLSMITDIYTSQDEYCIEYQVPIGYLPLVEIINNAIIPKSSLLITLKVILQHLRTFKQKSGRAFYFLNPHNIFINPEDNNIKVFGFFPNFEKDLCKYTPLNEDHISLDYFNKNDFRSFGYILFELFSPEKIHPLMIGRNKREYKALKNPYLNYMIFNKLLNEKYDWIYNSYDILKQDIEYALRKWDTYENDYDEFFKTIDFTIFKIIKWIHVVQNTKNNIFEQGASIFRYLQNSDLVNSIEVKNLLRMKKKGSFLFYEISDSILGSQLCNIIQISRKEINKCQKIEETQKEQCLQDFQSLFIFLLFFLEFERYSTHLITISFQKIKSKIKKITKEIPFKFMIENDSMEERTKEIIELFINSGENLTTKIILEHIYKFKEIINLLKFLSTQELKITSKSLNFQKYIIKPPLKKIIVWNPDIENKLNRLDYIYKNITNFPVPKHGYIENQEIILAILRWLKDIKLSLKIYNKRILNFKTFLRIQDYLPIEMKYWSYFKKRRKKINKPFMIPAQYLKLDEKEVFPIEFIRRRFKHKIASIVYPIQYDNRKMRIKSHLKIYKWNYLLIIIESLLIISAFLNVDDSIKNISILTSLLLPILAIVIDNLKKK